VKLKPLSYPRPSDYFVLRKEEKKLRVFIQKSEVKSNEKSKIAQITFTKKKSEVNPRLDVSYEKDWITDTKILVNIYKKIYEARQRIEEKIIS
jgi:hypothetical protein